MDRVRIGLVGFGTVGESFYGLLSRNAEEFARRLGVAIEVPLVGVRDVSRPRRVGPNTRVVSGWREILDDPTIPIVVELAGGVDEPLPLIREALTRKKHVITANKALLSVHGRELFALAGANGVELKFEAAVCGGIPIIKVLRESLMGNRVNSIVGIVNGTTNYILTRMTEEKLSFSDALAQAQAKGFAEADPTLDVSGGDAAQKIGLLASLAFGCWVEPRSILREGIAAVTTKDIEFCLSSGFVIKLVAQARMLEGAPLVTVFPALVPLDHPLAGVRNEFNGLLVDSDFLGPSVYEGRGAGGNPTASSVASDLGDLLTSILSRHIPRPSAPALPCAEPYPVDRMRSRYYFHFVTANRPGIWALVTGICAEYGINIESVHQKWEDKTRPSDLYMLVDEADEAQVRRSFAKILSSEGIFPESQFFRILAEPGGRAAVIDLHTHTFLSDGRLAPAELVRRAEHAGYRAIGIADHADASNLDSLISAVMQFVRETQPFMKIRIIPGVELTHVPPGQVAGLVRRARQLGVRLVILHGETVCEPVALGTNRAGIEAGVDILAHPGLISEEEVRLAAANGVHLEVSARHSHGLGNGRVVALAREAGAPLVVNSDAHSPSDILTPNWRERVAFGAGLTADELERINKTMISLVEKLVPSTFFA